jgi:hypothetical protein
MVPQVITILPIRLFTRILVLLGIYAGISSRPIRLQGELIRTLLQLFIQRCREEMVTDYFAKVTKTNLMKNSFLARISVTLHREFR